MTQLENNDSNSAVQLTHVTRTYKRDEFEVRALDDVTLDIPRKSFVAIMGPSGSGKTTLLNLVTGIDHATSGRVAVGGEEISTMNEREIAAWRARHIGLVFQFYNLIPVLTAFENVELPLLLTSLSKAERKKHVEMALTLVGLADRMHHYPRQLSGGQEQRVAIARAIASALTILGIATAVMAFGLIRTIVGAWNAGVTGAAANRMITRHRVSLIFPIPLPYRNEIARVPGVTGVSWANWFGGVYGEPNDFKNFWPRFAVDPDTYFDLYPEFQLPPDQLAAFKKERNACVIGRKLAQQHGFKLGDVITMEGDIYPGNWQWVVRGIYA